MMLKHTLVPRIFAFALSILVATGTLFAWAGPAAAADDDDDAIELVQADSPDDDENDKAENPTKRDRSTDIYTFTFSNGDSDDEKTYEIEYNGSEDLHISKTFLFRALFTGSTDNLTVDDPTPADAKITLSDSNIDITGAPLDNEVTITFHRGSNDYPVTVTCAKGEIWNGARTAEDSAVYGQSGSVDLKNQSCLPSNLSNVEYGLMTKKDEDRILTGAVTVDSNGTLTYTFADGSDNVDKTAKIIIPVKTSDDSIAPYKITVTLTVLDKEDQTIEADDVEGYVGETGKSIDAEAETDLSYEVTAGDDCVEVDADGNLTLKKEGVATVRITAEEDDTYKGTTKTVTVTVNPKYTVTVSTDGHGTAEATPEEAGAGTKIELKATPDDGYEFDGWEVVKGEVTIEDDSFEMPESDVEIKANFKEKPVTYTITFKGNGGSGSMSKQTGEKGTTVTLKANKFKRTGYTFTGWNTKKDGTGTTFKNKAKVKLNSDATLYAQWKKNSSSSKKSSSSSSSSSRLAQTDDPTDYSTMTALAIGGAILVGVGIFASKKLKKTDVTDEGESEKSGEEKSEAEGSESEKGE